MLLSCRGDWLEACVPPALLDSAAVVNHAGYDLKFEQAVYAYFSGYNVQAEVFPPLVPEFRNPLFLKTVCEAYEGEASPAEPLSFINVLAVWEARICERIHQAIDCPIARTKLAIRQILERMASDHASSIPAEKVHQICQAAFSNDADSRSLYRRLQSQGLLEEVQRGGANFIRLQYERFFDVRVARTELDGLSTRSALSTHWSQSVVPKLMKQCSSGISSAHLFAYALLLARDSLNIEIVDAELLRPLKVDATWNPEERVWRAWLEALPWRRIPSGNTTVPKLFLAWANSGRMPQEIHEVLLACACLERHPLNADFLHRILSRQSLRNRERLWTDPFAHEDLSFEGDGELHAFVDWCDSAGSRASDEQARLAAIVLIWLTSTTNRSNRNTATRVAIRLLSGRKAPVLQLVETFWAVDDPYVKERLLAVVAGVLPTLQRKSAAMSAMKSAGDSLRMERYLFTSCSANTRGSLLDTVRPKVF